ncbi:zinc-dependent metalloprotease [Portibacter marinus]|uniref:zinc-dependent metalloprotease n=1 Tax=Portibacter marinus TaxID=2898660 RepID=UPI001F31B006|nr:M12 family metallo-peptidase [Portibacter marinus]
MGIRKLFTLTFICLFGLSSNFAQSNKLANLVQSKKNQNVSFESFDIFAKAQNLRDANVDHSVFTMTQKDLKQLLSNDSEAIKIPLEFRNKSLTLELVEQEILSPGFNVKTSSGNPFFGQIEAKFYRGIVEGDKNSIVALSFMEDRLIGIIDSRERGNLVIGRLQNSKDKYILFDNNQREDKPNFDCDTEMLQEVRNNIIDGNTGARVENCVNVYFECEHDMFLEEGSVQNTVNQLTGIFNIVATLYANESITTKISEIKVWDTPDSYATTSTSNALTSFRSQVPSYNGDLAHLVSRGAPSGGGIAWVNALCTSYGYSYSYIYSYYNELPSYSWTTNVITHEMGHNLGSPHTHSCVWNGNNTAIDGCAAARGYGDPNCPTPPLPNNGGTIMSYCHLVSGVGINMSNGFGPQPGDLIRSRVAGATCLSPCADCTDEGLLCDDGDPCTTGDVYDANCNCIGTPEPDSDGDGVCDAEDVCPGFDDGLIGTSCDDGDACTVNDIYGADCNCTGSLADSDGDGICDGEDVCPGFDDAIDSDGDGVPDGCDLDCQELTGTFAGNPLTHSGGGSSSTSYVFDRTSQNISFTVSGINSVTGGKPSDRYTESVNVVYINEEGQTVNYGSFNGNQGSVYNVSISAKALSVEVNLSDSYDGSASGLSVNLSSINYCEDNNQCLTPDSDGDGVCDADDLCPGFNDALDADGDGIPDGCDDCSSVTFTMNPSTLTHSGGGSSTSTVDFMGIADNVSFTISGLGSKLNGKGSGRYDESVSINYVDGSGAVVNYGSFNGANVAFVNVTIPVAQSVSVALSDAYDGNSSTLMSVSISEVETCASALPENLGESVLGTDMSFSFWPNPTRQQLLLDYSNKESVSDVVNMDIFDMNGQLVISKNYRFEGKVISDRFSIGTLPSGIYMIKLQDGENLLTDKLIKID